VQKTDLLKPPRAGRKTLKCLITHSGVGTGKSVTFERLRPDCYVGAYIYSLDVSESAASGIVEKRSRALGCVAAGGVEQRAVVPTAVFSFPVFSTSVPAPTPVLKLPVVTLLSENQPTAVLAAPVVRLKGRFALRPW
jgi:hypothetical protein